MIDGPRHPAWREQQRPARGINIIAVSTVNAEPQDMLNKPNLGSSVQMAVYTVERVYRYKA
ncbi:hypothetical protein [Dyella jiangningensis]|uniref:hypothetical protein n=1 Tax=Dyella jiangningensis TaxID=1379159 RepID=UPI0015585BB0|nr:hypothetical protein [Dyella jiangningensis]